MLDVDCCSDFTVHRTSAEMRCSLRLRWLSDAEEIRTLPLSMRKKRVQPQAVVLDSVDPFRPIRNLSQFRGQERRFEHAGGQAQQVPCLPTP